MSGAVNTVKDVVTAASAPIWMPYKAGFNLVAHGTNPFRDVGDSIHTAAGAASQSVVKPIMDGITPQKPLPDITAPDPNAVMSQQQAARHAAARQMQIDTMTSKPGRGGTILTDNFQYKV